MPVLKWSRHGISTESYRYVGGPGSRGPFGWLPHCQSCSQRRRRRPRTRMDQSMELTVRLDHYGIGDTQRKPRTQACPLCRTIAHL